MKITKLYAEFVTTLLAGLLHVVAENVTDRQAHTTCMNEKH